MNEVIFVLDAPWSALRSFPRSAGSVKRAGGFLSLEAYAALGEGRSVALSGADGSIDGWCCPNMDSPTLFDRLLNPADGGYFAIAPDEPFGRVATREPTAPPYFCQLDEAGRYFLLGHVLRAATTG